MRIAIVLFFILAFSPTWLHAAENIGSYDVAIDVMKSGDIAVRETIEVSAEGRQIRRGIYRDLPRYYDKGGSKIPFAYDVVSVARNGRAEQYIVQKTGNAFRIRIGSADRLLTTGTHTYVIHYTVQNQIRHFADHDELYWNAIGQYWAFPVELAKVSVRFPEGAKTEGVHAYTGRFGEQGGAYRYRAADGAHIFEATKAFAPREGMTISVSIAKGLIDPPSAAELRREWLARYGGLAGFIVAILGLGGFYAYAFNRYGRDPVKGPVFPRYEPPEGFSPAGCHHVYHRRLNGHNALIASLINLGVTGHIKIEDAGKNKTTLQKLPGHDAKAEPFPIESRLLDDLYSGTDKKTIGGATDRAFTRAYHAFQTFSAKKFGAPYFKWNPQFLIFGLVFSAAAIFFIAQISNEWTGWHTVGAAILVALNAMMSYFMPAPTPIGQKVRTEIEGFRLYMDKAEKLQLNAATAGNGAPPPMTTDRYERFLPYAVALGVEKPWTRHFERLLPKEARDYSPNWSNMGRNNYSSLHGLNSALVSSMSSGVSSALPQSSSSSGSGGGGFSGGGGGGGGGGGW